MSEYWDWWWGALALGTITVAHHMVVGRRLGVSSAWERLVHWKSERRVELLDAEFNDADFEAAMAEAAAELELAAPRAASRDRFTATQGAAVDSAGPAIHSSEINAPRAERGADRYSAAKGAPRCAGGVSRHNGAWRFRRSGQFRPL